MSLSHRHQPHRDLHVQWADEANARGGAFLHRLSVAHDEIDNSDEGDDEAWFPPPSEVSRARPGPPLLQQTLSTPPDKWRRSNETLNYDEYSSEEEKLEWRDDANNSASSCSRPGSTCSGIYSDDDDTAEIGRKLRYRQVAATVRKKKGLRDSDGDRALLAAPVHASSCLLSQSPSPLTSNGQASTESSAGHTAFRDREACTLKERLGQHNAWPPSHSSERRPPDSSSPHRAGRRSEYLAGCAIEPDLSPQNVAVCRSSINSDSSSSSALSPQPCYHSSTAVHEPRARCGCRGLTVKVDSGPLGLSLEASYRMEEGFVLKQAWSDCAADSGTFTHTVHVQNPGKRDDDDHVGALDLGLKGRSSSSGLIKVRRVGLESAGGATRRSGVLVRPPLPQCPGNTSTKEALSSAALLGVLEVEQGDILVRVDDVQVRISLFAAIAWLVMLLCRLRGK